MLRKLMLFLVRKIGFEKRNFGEFPQGKDVRKATFDCIGQIWRIISL
jgi:hypothetical protein